MWSIGINEANPEPLAQPSRRTYVLGAGPGSRAAVHVGGLLCNFTANYRHHSVSGRTRPTPPRGHGTPGLQRTSWCWRERLVWHWCWCPKTASHFAMDPGGSKGRGGGERGWGEGWGGAGVFVVGGRSEHPQAFILCNLELRIVDGAASGGCQLSAFEPSYLPLPPPPPPSWLAGRRSNKDTGSPTRWPPLLAHHHDH